VEGTGNGPQTEFKEGCGADFSEKKRGELKKVERGKTEPGGSHFALRGKKAFVGLGGISLVIVVFLCERRVRGGWSRKH